MSSPIRGWWREKRRLSGGVVTDGRGRGSRSAWLEEKEEGEDVCADKIARAGEKATKGVGAKLLEPELDIIWSTFN